VLVLAEILGYDDFRTPVVTILLWLLAVVVVIVGLVGVVLPGLPGHVLILAGLVLGAWAEDFTRVGMPTLVVLGVLAVATYVIDFVAAVLGARRLGASTRAMTGAALGTLFGMFMGLPGIIVGPFLGAVLGELTVQADLIQAGRAGVAAWIGFAVGAAVKVAIAFVMIGVFLAAMVF
jgi:uncharacterized protein YqgC (DUF456 family)